MDRIVLFVYSISPYLTTAFADGTTPIERVTDTVTRIASLEGLGADPIVIGASVDTNDWISLREKAPTTWKFVNAEESSAASVYRSLMHHVSEETEQFVCLRIDAPFQSSDWAGRLLDLQRRSWCDYTFADGYPIGFTPEVMRRDLLPVMVSLAESTNQPWEPGSVFETLSKDINAFDIETEAAPEDYSILRVHLTCDSRQNYLVCRKIVERAESDDYLAVLDRYPEVRRSLPQYYQVQVTTEMAQRPTYSPWNDERWRGDDPGTGRHIDSERWKEILGAIAVETPEATIAIGYRGEPSLNPHITEIIEAVDEYPGLILYIETSGIGWQPEAIKTLSRRSVGAVIVEVDAIKPDTYRALRGDQRIEEAEQFVHSIRNLIPGRVYVQATRMRSNEWELQEFYKRWSQVDGVTVIIQKYNSFAGRLEDRRVADLTPLTRMACRHLERDMVVLLDGTVPMCIQDIDTERPRGSILRDAVATVWQRGEDDFKKHIEGTFDGICEFCDEYYTFNA